MVGRANVALLPRLHRGVGSEIEGEEMSKLLHPGLPAKFFEEYRLQRLDIAKAKAVLDEAADRIKEFERELESKRNPR